jgi:hypothetical protein
MTTTTSVSSPGVRARSARTRFVLFAAVGAFSFLLLSGTAAYAQQPGTGLRAGVSGDPDQFYFGAHFDTGPIFDRLSFRPNAEIGVGDNTTSVTGNFEFVYWWPIRRHPWNIYAGGGPAVNVYRWGDNNPHHEGGSTDVKPGFNILFGAAHKGGLFAELKLGFIDSPEVKFGVGYTWK